MEFSRSILSQGAALVVIQTAREMELFHDGDAVNVAPELAEAEHELFVKMLAKFHTVQAARAQQELSHDEVSSLFTFVYAKAAEVVTNFRNFRKNEFDLLGMLDGKVPFFAHDCVADYFRRHLDFPSKCAENYLNWYTKDAEISPMRSVDPTLLLFESLKWTFRLSCHFAIEQLG